MNRIKDQIRCGAAYRLGLTGKGIGVAVLDTGIFLHRDFDSRVTGFADMVNGKNFAYDDCRPGSQCIHMFRSNDILDDQLFIFNDD